MVGYRGERGLGGSHVKGRGLACRRQHVRRHAVLHDFFARRELTSERRHLDHFGAELHVRQAEPPADNPAVAEQFLDLVRMR